MVFVLQFVVVVVVSICFNCLLTDQITKIILVDTLVHPSNKPVDLVLFFSLLMWHITLINMRILEKNPRIPGINPKGTSLEERGRGGTW